MKLFGEESTAPKAYFRGTHRSVAPAETLARYAPHLRDLGITRLADITGLDCIGLPVYVAIRPSSRNLATAQGKGFDHDAAKASAMMESIESWHAERLELPLVHESYRALVRTHDAVDPKGLAVAAGNTPRHDVPYLWVRGWDLMNERHCYVPHDLASLNGVFAPGFRPTFAMSSNGLSSGNHALEATVHALCEVIERDALSLWALGRRTRSARRSWTSRAWTIPCAARCSRSSSARRSARWRGTSRRTPACGVLVPDRRAPRSRAMANHRPRRRAWLPPVADDRAPPRADRGDAVAPHDHFGQPRRHALRRLRFVRRSRQHRARVEAPRGERRAAALRRTSGARHVFLRGGRRRLDGSSSRDRPDERGRRRSVAQRPAHPRREGDRAGGAGSEER